MKLQSFTDIGGIDYAHVFSTKNVSRARRGRHKKMIDEEYEQREQEYLNYTRLITEQYSKYLDDTREAQTS